MARVRRFGGALAVICISLATLAIGLVAVPREASAQVIQSVEIEGNRRIEEATVRTYLQLSEGDRYSPALANESLKALFDTGLYADVWIDMEGNALVVRLVENPIINRVAFEGNRKFDDETLEREVQARPRTVFTRARVQADVQRLITLYRRAGRFSAQIEPKIIEQPQDRVDLVFEITEGPLTEISRINFIGNAVFSDSELRDVILTAESTWWDEIIGSGQPYDPDKLNFDRELLRRHYLKNGYADFQVVSAVAELDRGQENFFITFTVEEGPQYRFGAIEIDSGLSNLPTGLIEAQLLTHEGDVYNGELVEKTVENITVEAGELGFAFIEVRPRPDRDPLTLTISITYVVDDGPRIYIERIDVIGNVRTHDYVIRREFRLAEGDAFNRTLLEKARRNLLGLGFFSSVDIATEDGSAPDRLVVRVIVVEKSTGDLSFGVGYSTVDAVIGEVSITERNLLGRGQFLRIKAAVSGSREQIDIRFTEPRFMGSRVAFGVDLFGNETDSKSESSFKSSQIGGGFRLGLPMQENLYLNTRYSFTREELFGVNPLTASAPVLAAVGIANVSQVGYSLVYDTLNDPLKPTSGVKASLSQDFAGVGGDVQFLRTEGSAIYFHELWPDVIGSVRGSGGHIFGWGGQSVRLLDAFFKGGETIRGFERSGIGPRDATTGATSGDALGGKTFAATSVEVTFPLGLPDELGIRGAAFVDAGTLFGTDVTTAIADSSAVRASVGGSILWDSPIGPLRFDVAEAFLKQPFDRPEVFRFSGGVSF